MPTYNAFTPQPKDPILWQGKYWDGNLVIKQDKDSILYYVFVNQDFQCTNGIIIPEEMYSDRNWDDIFELFSYHFKVHYQEATTLFYNVMKAQDASYPGPLH